MEKSQKVGNFKTRKIGVVSFSQVKRYHEGGALYATAWWKNTRSAQLQNYPQCLYCNRNGVLSLAVEVDHIIPHKGDKNLFYGGVLQSLCKTCHSKKTQKENFTLGKKI